MLFIAPGYKTNWVSTNPKPDPDRDEDKLAAEERGEANKKVLREALTAVLRTRNLLVLCGLGTSLCVKDSRNDRVAPTMRDLWDDAKDLLGDKKFDRLLKVVKYDPDESGENIEYLLSQCQLAQRFVEDEIIEDFISKAEEMIVKRCCFVNDETSLDVHEAFLSRIARRPPQLPRPRIFTTNYDLTIETAANRRRFTVLDGFSHTLPQYFDPNNYAYDIVRRSDSHETPEYIPNAFYFYKLHGSVDWTRSGQEIQKTESPKEPLLIYPSNTKYETSYKSPFIEVISEYQMSLRQSESVLIVVGFGFNDDHLSEPIMSAIKSNVGLRIVVVDPALKESGARRMKKLKQLAKLGDARIILLNCDFEEFVEVLPDLVAQTEEEAHYSRVRQ